MLISELIKHTPEDHADLENLKQALSALQSVALEINEAVREAERQARLNKIARKFLDAREKTVRKVLYLDRQGKGGQVRGRGRGCEGEGKDEGEGGGEDKDEGKGEGQ
jgi:exonuclease VII small subunit